MPQPKTFKAGLEFIERNKSADNWFLQIETFDPHEPFFSAARYKGHYAEDYLGPMFDWPIYQHVQETDEQVKHLRLQYAALLSMCDKHLGDVLDAFDRHDLWKDTMLIVWTDHGFLLGERGLWAKVRWPFFEEIAHTPFFVWDPRIGKAGERRQSLVQPSIDLGPTILEFFGVERSKNMTGQPLRAVLENDTPIREAGIFGMHGAQVNVTDGRYVYMRAGNPERPAAHYTLMPTGMREPFSVDLCRTGQFAQPFDFMKGVPTMRFQPDKSLLAWHDPQVLQTMLFDLKQDPGQTQPLRDPAAENRMIELLRKEMRRLDAPQEQYERLGIVN
jgi:arylsulfatase A-like enzyme